MLSRRAGKARRRARKHAVQPGISRVTSLPWFVVPKPPVACNQRAIEG
jgi:hypothetical protein